ncbi:MAG: hypothetical protein IJ280_07210 [Bacteroidales bacterium]|nr:hypothetical protein [Bacteroidales bacterium]
MEKKGNHGGARPGAGRKPMNRVAVNIRLDKEIVERLPKDKSEFINKILKEYFKI